MCDHSKKAGSMLNQCDGGREVDTLRACTADLCGQGLHHCPCPTACEVPEEPLIETAFSIFAACIAILSILAVVVTILYAAG